MENFKDVLFEKYDEYENQADDSKKKIAYKKRILRLIEQQSASELDSDAYYIWGMVLYMADNNKMEDKKTALEKFFKSFELDSSNFLACLYIAHCYHDNRMFRLALQFYEQVDKNDLRKFEIWRYVKLIEQIGYCHFRLGEKEIGRQCFLEVLQWYKKLPIEDIAFPVELLDCLSKNDSIVLEIKKIQSA